MPLTTVVWSIWLVQFWLIRSCFSQKGVSRFQVSLIKHRHGTKTRLPLLPCVFFIVFDKRTWDPSTQLVVWYIFHLGPNSDQEKVVELVPENKGVG